MKKQFVTASRWLAAVLVFVFGWLAACQVVMNGSPAESMSASMDFSTHGSQDLPVSYSFSDAAATSTAPPASSGTLGVASSGFNAWCLPVTSSATLAAWPRPQDAISPTNGKTGIVFVYPVRSCTFVFTFTTPPPAGTELRVFDAKYDPKKPWLTALLQFSADNPKVGYATLTHTYIVNPPLWNVSYRLSVAGPDGEEYWTMTVLMKRSWLGLTCWNGRWQNPVTMRCPVPAFGDRHPTDWGYHLPTPTPGGDPKNGYFLGQ
jgi:hypothetical protein